MKVIPTNIAEPTPRYADSPDSSQSQLSGYGDKKHFIETHEIREQEEDIRMSQNNLTPIGYFSKKSSADCI